MSVIYYRRNIPTKLLSWKMAFVDPRLLETLQTPIQPPIDTNLRDLDSEMTSILDKTGIDVSEKVRLYNQALLRYNDMAKM